MNYNHLDEIANKAKNDDDHSLAELCKLIYPKVYSYTFYKVNDKEDAKDLAGEVLLKVINLLKSYKGHFLPWMYKITTNLIIDYYRHKSVIKNAKEKIANEIHFQPINQNPEESITKWELKEKLGKLTEEQKEVVILKFIQGHTNDEAAKITGKSVGAIKVLQFRALKSLNEKMRVD